MILVVLNEQVTEQSLGIKADRLKAAYRPVLRPTIRCVKPLVEHMKNDVHKLNITSAKNGDKGACEQANYQT